MRNKYVNFRASEQEIKELNRLVKQARMSKTEFIRHAIFNKEIIVIDGLKELQKQLKPIGNNLNQLTTRANMGQFSTVNLTQTKEELGKIQDALTALCQKKRELSEQEPSVEIPEEPQIILPPVPPVEHHPPVENPPTPEQSSLGFPRPKRNSFFSYKGGE